VDTTENESCKAKKKKQPPTKNSYHGENHENSGMTDASGRYATDFTESRISPWKTWPY